MNKTLKLLSNDYLHVFIGNRGLKVYRRGVHGKLGIPGLSKIVIEMTGHAPKHDEAYAFYAKERDIVKVLVRNHGSSSIMEFYDGQARQLKEFFVEMTLL